MKRLFLSLVTAIAVIAIATGILAWISLQPPAWYAPPDFSDPEVAKLAETALNIALTRNFTKYALKKSGEFELVKMP